ncbi:DUF6098 family protein [Leucobacter triazinivorans]|uniref:Uncharacterized protein n=1 Tax=Leucobacter triazinivorans TaxID=1784719 RepID=A0A4P6KFK4_9MICO|nr:DUF6098 family protein [Leucobacter triazinivorans]QBE48224.1 hypothetical protein EVS81_04735 [Leucobacter triazinivorans]
MSAPFDTASSDFELQPLATLDQLEGTLRRYPALHLRTSDGPVADALHPPVDPETGLGLPGLPGRPLAPEDWWYRPVADWIARQLRRARPTPRDPVRFAWVLTGSVTARGPEGEPLLADVVPVARLSEAVLDEAEERYRNRFPPVGHPAA